MGEFVIAFEAREPVPVGVDAVDPRIIGAVQFAFQLQVVGRIGEDHVDAAFRHGVHQLDTVADMDGVGISLCLLGGGLTFGGGRLAARGGRLFRHCQTFPGPQYSGSMARAGVAVKKYLDSNT